MCIEPNSKDLDNSISIKADIQIFHFFQYNLIPTSLYFLIVNHIANFHPLSPSPFPASLPRWNPLLRRLSDEQEAIRSWPTVVSNAARPPEVALHTGSISQELINSYRQSDRHTPSPLPITPFRAVLIAIVGWTGSDMILTFCSKHFHARPSGVALYTWSESAAVIGIKRKHEDWGDRIGLVMDYKGCLNASYHKWKLPPC